MEREGRRSESRLDLRAMEWVLLFPSFLLREPRSSGFFAGFRRSSVRCRRRMRSLHPLCMGEAKTAAKLDRSRSDRSRAAGQSRTRQQWQRARAAAGFWHRSLAYVRGWGFEPEGKVAELASFPKDIAACRLPARVRAIDLCGWGGAGLASRVRLDALDGHSRARAATASDPQQLMPLATPWIEILRPCFPMRPVAAPGAQVADHLAGDALAHRAGRRPQQRLALQIRPAPQALLPTALKVVLISFNRASLRRKVQGCCLECGLRS